MTRKGINSERQLVKLFWENEFAAIRVPASGAGAKSYPKPDIIVGNGKHYLAFEVKTTQSEKIYLHNAEIDELVSFSKQFGCKPFVAVKFGKKSREWRFFEIPAIRRTFSGNYVITFESDFTKGKDFSSLLDSVR
ncbi:MAG: Holliday junction resolvase Hjc [Candidatus Helarchaeota archaeon]